jgi:hypothetical protein
MCPWGRPGTWIARSPKPRLVAGGGAKRRPSGLGHRRFITGDTEGTEGIAIGFSDQIRAIRVVRGQIHPFCAFARSARSRLFFCVHGHTLSQPWVNTIPMECGLAHSCGALVLQSVTFTGEFRQPLVYT